MPRGPAPDANNAFGQRIDALGHRPKGLRCFVPTKVPPWIGRATHDNGALHKTRTPSFSRAANTGVPKSVS